MWLWAHLLMNTLFCPCRTVLRSVPMAFTLSSSPALPSPAHGHSIRGGVQLFLTLINSLLTKWSLNNEIALVSPLFVSPAGCTAFCLLSSTSPSLHCPAGTWRKTGMKRSRTRTRWATVLPSEIQHGIYASVKCQNGWIKWREGAGRRQEWWCRRGRWGLAFEGTLILSSFIHPESVNASRDVIQIRIETPAAGWQPAAKLNLSCKPNSSSCVLNPVHHIRNIHNYLITK